MATSIFSTNSTIVRYLNLALVRLSFALGSWLGPAATLRRAYRLFCTPFASSRRRAVEAGPAGADITLFPHGRDRVAVYTWGIPASQPWILLAHGWSSHATRFHAWIEPLRRAGYAVVGFDQLGHGRSSGERTNLPEFASVLAAVASQQGRAAAVIGHSMGGAAATLALAETPVADRVILIAPLADPLAAASRFSRFVGLADRLAGHLFDAYESTHDLRVASLQAHLKSPVIACPALVVHDLEDREVPWAEGERYARHWPGARLLSTTGLGHHRIVDDCEVIGASLRFLRGETVGERVVSSPNLPYGIA